MLSVTLLADYDYSTSYTVSLLAGIPSGSKDGQGTAARFFSPRSVVVDSSGNVFVADSNNHTVRKITPDGMVTTFAGKTGEADVKDGTGSQARLADVSSLGIDAADNLYALDFGTIRKISPTGTVSTMPGLALATFGGDSGLTVDEEGTVYVSDREHHKIYRYRDGALTVLAGSTAGSANGTGTSAQFSFPSGITVDKAGNLYVADSGNCTIRKITSAGGVTTLAGLAGSPGQADGIGAAARFWYPTGLSVDASGVVYVADWGSSTIRKILSDGTVSTLAGTPAFSGSTDGSANSATFNEPVGLAVSSTGAIYVADTGNHAIRLITTSGLVTTLAGLSSSGSNDGPALTSRFLNPSGVALDSQDNLYVADQLNNTIRKVTSAGVVSTLAGIADGMAGWLDGSAKVARFWWPTHIAVDAADNVFVSDTMNNVIRKITPAGTVSTYAGTPVTVAGGSGVGGLNPGGHTDGPASLAQFYGPAGLVFDKSGNLYVADQGNHTIRKITAKGTVTTLAGLAGESGSKDGQGSTARFTSPSGIAIDSSGNLYVADFLDHTVRRITPDGIVSTIAGQSGVDGSNDGSAGQARFRVPTSIALDPSGNIYVADSVNDTVRRISVSGAVSTLAGYAGNNGYGAGETTSVGSVDGVGKMARFNYPYGIVCSSTGVLYVSDLENNAIRILTPPQSSTPTSQPPPGSTSTSQPPPSGNSSGGGSSSSGGGGGGGGAPSDCFLLALGGLGLLRFWTRRQIRR